MWTCFTNVTEIYTYASNKIVPADPILRTDELSLYGTEHFWSKYINLLNPTGHVMYQQFNIQQL